MRQPIRFFFEIKMLTWSEDEFSSELSYRSTTELEHLESVLRKRSGLDCENATGFRENRAHHDRVDDVGEGTSDHVFRSFLPSIQSLQSHAQRDIC